MVFFELSNDLNEVTVVGALWHFLLSTRNMWLDPCYAYISPTTSSSWVVLFQYFDVLNPLSVKISALNPSFHYVVMSREEYWREPSFSVAYEL